jgi:hypothetical protein
MTQNNDSPTTQADLPKLLDDITAFYRRYVVMTEAQARVVSAFTVHTHVVAAAESTPFLAVTSAEKESGKTRLLEVMEMLVNKPLRVSSISPAALYSRVEVDAPTLLFDEMDAVFDPRRKDNEALRGLLNAGNRRGSKVSRVNMDEGRKVEEFELFCPRVLAGIGRLPETIESRSLHIRLKRRLKSEIVERLGPRQRRQAAAEIESIRERLVAFASANLEALKGAEPAFPPGLRDREEDAAEPLFAIADLVGGDWPNDLRAAVLEVCHSDEAHDPSKGVQLLQDVLEVFEQKGVKVISAGQLVEALIKIEDAPWSEYSFGKPLTTRGLGRLLAGYGILARTVRVDGRTPKGYMRSWFEDAWERYVPHSDADFSSPASGKTTQAEKPTQANAGTASELIQKPTQFTSGVGVPDDPVSLFDVGQNASPEAFVSVVTEAPHPTRQGSRAEFPCMNFNGAPSDRCSGCGWEKPFHSIRPSGGPPGMGSVERL